MKGEGRDEASTRRSHWLAQSPSRLRTSKSGVVLVTDHPPQLCEDRHEIQLPPALGPVVAYDALVLAGRIMSSRGEEEGKPLRSIPLGEVLPAYDRARYLSGDRPREERDCFPARTTHRAHHTAS